MQRFGWKFGSILAASLLAVLGAALPSVSRAQSGAPGSIHGHVNNPLGQLIVGGGVEVRLTQDVTADEKSRKYPYVFPVDASGNYKGTDIKPGTYLVAVYQGSKSLDYFPDISIVTGVDKELNFDMSRKEYIDKMTPEDRKTLEEFKKKNADIMAANAKISNLNALLGQARAANKAGNYDAAITAMTTATQAKPDEAILWTTLGDAQLGAANAAAAAAKAAGTPVTDPSILDKYKTAATSYQKAIDMNAASKKPNPETAGASYNQLGQALAKAGDVKGAAAAYDGAAKANPPATGMYMFNEAAILLNAGENDGAAAAADKAIAADPTRADSYYIKGQALIVKVAVDPKTNKVVAPPGCVEAYQKYLELAPEGSHAKDVKDILTGIGASITSTYKAAPTKRR